MNPTGKCLACNGEGVAMSHQPRARLHVAGQSSESWKNGLPPCSECMGDGQVEYVMAAPTENLVLIEVRFKDGKAHRYSVPPDFLHGEGMVIRPDRNEKVLVKHRHGAIVDEIEGLGTLIYLFEEIRFDVPPGATYVGAGDDAPAHSRRHRELGLRICRNGHDG